MKRIAITGGIGAGKTAATDYLGSRGFSVVDADVIAHQVTEPGRPAWQALRDAFGDAVLNPDSTLNRAFVAQIVFHDPAALRRLNLITHGQIGLEMLRQLDEASGDVVFIALPLFRPEHRDLMALDEVWSVQASPEVAVERLVVHRHFSEDDAVARLANQITNEQRAAIVDHVIWNDGSVEELHEKLDEHLRRLGSGRG